jgi:hypothetical protein
LKLLFVFFYILPFEKYGDITWKKLAYPAAKITFYDWSGNGGTIIIY